MGLDVYLTRCTDLKAATELENIYEEKAEAIWNEYPAYALMTPEQKEEARQRRDDLAREMGIGEYGESLEKERVEIDSALYPDHLFKVGYFRSSYNAGGINRVFDRLGIPNLYDIFSPGDGYEFTPDWNRARENVVLALSSFDEKTSHPLYDVTDVTLYDFDEIRSPEAAIQHYLDRTGSVGIMNAFSSRDGLFYREGQLNVVGVMPGRDCIGSPVVYLVTKQEAKDYEWYRHALEIVLETIDYVLKKDPENHYLCWSG